jgi:hypothetical protein
MEKKSQAVEGQIEHSIQLSRGLLAICNEMRWSSRLHLGCHVMRMFV